LEVARGRYGWYGSIEESCTYTVLLLSQSAAFVLRAPCLLNECDVMISVGPMRVLWCWKLRIREDEDIREDVHPDLDVDFAAVRYRV